MHVRCMHVIAVRQYLQVDSKSAAVREHARQQVAAVQQVGSDLYTDLFVFEVSFRARGSNLAGRSRSYSRSAVRRTASRGGLQQVVSKSSFFLLKEGEGF
jgi:DNA anti-recombination protein RmuC